MGSCASATSTSHLRKNGSDVEVEGRRGGEELTTSPVQPSRSSRCGQSVGMLTKLRARAPCDVRLQLHEHRVGAGERAGRAQGRAERLPAHLGRVELVEAGDLDVAEAVVGEARLEHLDAVSAQRELVALGGAAQVLGVERAVGVEHLAVAQHDVVARCAAGLEAHHTRRVLAEVDDVALWPAHDRARLQLGDRPPSRRRGAARPRRRAPARSCTGSQPASSKSARSQPGCASRRSTRCPWMRSARWTAPVLARQPSPLQTRSAVPSSSSISSCSRNAGWSP